MASPSRKKKAGKKSATRKRASGRSAGRTADGRNATRVKARKAGRGSKQKVRSGWFFWPLVARVVFGLLLCLAGFLFYLDRQIVERFSGNVHPQPAHVYARAHELIAGQGPGQSKLLSVLKYLGYREVKRIAGPGTYVVVGKKMDLHINPVASSPNQPSQLRLEFADDRLLRILDHRNGRAVKQVSLEPERIGSLQLGPYEDRIALQLHQIPELLIKALLTLEDRHFESHIGIDPVAIGRALKNNLLKLGAVQGGSTITQQLVKNIFLSPERSLSRKALEALMALVMEMRYSKSEILEFYINEIFLGQSGNRAVHGFALASEYYFARPVSQLELHETALLVGMIPAPSFYNPRRHPKRALARRNLVLSTLAEVGAISSQSAQQQTSRPLAIAPHRASSSGRFPAYTDYLHRQIRQYFPEEVLRRDGLNLYTTLDAEVQQHAQRGLSETLVALEKKHGIDQGTLQGAVVVVDIDSGDILSLVGDRKPGFSGFNRAIDAQRPIGSLIKPLVYLTALEDPGRYSLATVVEDTPLTLQPENGEEWSPQNYDKTFRGTTSVLEALVRSYNVPTVRVGLDIGVDQVIATINRLGVERKIKNYPSLLLGANDHSPLEIAQMYQPLANHGKRLPLRSIRRISSRSGEEIARFPGKSAKVIDQAPAFLLDFALKQVVRRGTAAALGASFSPSLQIAGKTGTTDNYRDSWFAGYSGNLLTVVWVGRDDNKPIGLTGSSGAMRVWQKVMQSLWLVPAEIELPQSIKFVDIDPASGLLARSSCPQRVSLPVTRRFAIDRYAPCSGFLGRVQSWFNIRLGETVVDELPALKPQTPVVESEPMRQSGIVDQPTSVRAQPVERKVRAGVNSEVDDRR